MRGSTFTAIVTAAALSLTPTLAAAAEPRAGVLPLEIEGDLPPNGSKSISAEIEAGLQGTGATLVPESELAKAVGGKSKKAARKKLAACSDAACLQGLATTATATHLVRPAIRMEDSGDYVISLELVDGATGEVVHRASQTCELCGLTEAQQVARSLATSLQDAMAGAGKVAVESTPAGAEVLVDGEPAGTAPVELRLSAGEHTIVLRLPGHVDEEHHVVVALGETAALAIELDAVPVAPPVDARPRNRGAWLGRLGWASIGIGFASVGSGIALLVLDENPVAFTRCSGIDVDAAGNCRFRHDTLAGGVVMTIVGVVGITAGAILVARDRKGNKGPRKGDARRARVRPALRGLAIEF